MVEGSQSLRWPRGTRSVFLVTAPPLLEMAASLIGEMRATGCEVTCSG